MARKKTEKTTTTNRQNEIDLEFMGSREESPDRSVTSRNRIRDKMRSDIEDFLSHGGRINHIDPHVTADPPRKPTSNYGGRPI